MKIILISLIIILIYYAIFKNSSCCEGFESFGEGFESFGEGFERCDKGIENGKQKKSKMKQLFSEIIDIAKNLSKKTKVDKSFINATENDVNSKLIVEQPLSESKKGQLLINKLLAERNKSKAEMKIASDKLFGKAVSESIVDSSYDDKFVVNSTLGDLGTVLPKLENKDKEGKIHLDKLPKCKVPMKTNLINNYNHIINSGHEIYQDILKPESNKTFIHNVRHNLMQVAWIKSSLQWHGENIQLEIRFTNINPSNGQRVHIVFPLKLVNTYYKIEKFTDTYFNLNFNEFNQKTSNKIADLKKGVMFPVLEDKLNIFNKNLTDNHISKLDTKLKYLESNLKIKKAIFKANAEGIKVENIINQKFIDTIEQITTKVDNINLEKEKVFNNPIQDNPMIIEIKKDSDSIINQMKNGMNLTRVDIKDFKKNNTFNKEKVFHTENKVKDILKNSEIKKINMTTIPKSVSLNDIKKKLESTNFNFVTKEIKHVKYSYGDIDTLLNLNSLIVDSSIIPDYLCCKPTIGKLINMDFCQIEKKIIAQDLFYYTHGNDGSLILITQPHPFEMKIGNVILENLS